MPDLAAAALAVNRFGFGARPGELREIASDPRGWVKAQLGPQPVPAPIAALPPAEDDLLAFGRWLAHQRLNSANGARVAQRAERQGATPQQVQQLSTENSFIQNFRERVLTSVSARFSAAITTDKPVHERLVHFWSNHFTVSSAKPAAVALPPAFEREAIRPHVGGKFADMLLASTKHPGMLVYLDNWNSIGPHSLAARDPRLARSFLTAGGRATGLNENLAREIMELHTLGVNGGYSQADVQALAAIITGWTFQRQNLIDFVSDKPGTKTGAQLFWFDSDAHEPGSKTLLAKPFAENGIGQGEAALHMLAKHPSTARFVATKLTRHYVADTPPPAVVARVADAFTRSDGDLHATMIALADSPEVWATPFAKFKLPEEYAISCLRAANARTLEQASSYGAVTAMGQRPYAAPGPDGWADTADTWLTADLVWKRLEFAQAFAGRIAAADLNPVDVGEASFGPLFSAETRQTVQRAESPEQGLALLFAAPEFQRR